MKKYCKFCGCEVYLRPPSEVNHKYYSKDIWKYSKSKWLIYDDDGNIIAEWIGKDAINSWFGRCDCGKRIFHIEDEIPPDKNLPNFRSNIDNRKVVEVWHDKLYLFELGKSWYKPPYIPNDNIQDIKTVNQLDLFG